MECIYLISMLLAVSPSVDSKQLPDTINMVPQFFTQRLDHFNFPSDPRTFKQLLLINDSYSQGKGDPILFYCGAESPLAERNSDFMHHLAKTLNATILSAEHRYYGSSLPFDNPFKQPNIQYLSVQQTLADYANVIREFKQDAKYVNSSVITFGGSYGGMLSAYMRATYPGLVQGAIASSGPVNMCVGIGNPHRFFESVTTDFQTSKPACGDKVKEAFDEILEVAKNGTAGWKILTEKLKLCSPIESTNDVDWVLKWLRNGFIYTAMFDYPSLKSTSQLSGEEAVDLPPSPSPLRFSNRINNLVPWAVNASCEHFLAQPDHIEGLREAVAIFYGQSKCYDYKSQYIECSDITGCGLDNASLSWDFQCCTQINLYDGSNSTKDNMFPSLPLTKKRVMEECKTRWQVEPSYDQLALQYGPESWSATTNIVFINGDLDPWMQGGITADISDTVKAVIIHDGAHCSDLKEPTEDDPASLKAARRMELEEIKKWIEQHRASLNSS